MFGFGSSSGSSSTPSGAASSPTEAPNRDQRKQCWSSRDVYFACLDKSGVMNADENNGACEAEKKEYEKACGKSWIEYFNKRRILEMRRDATQAAAAAARDANPANKGR